MQDSALVAVIFAPRFYKHSANRDPSLGPRVLEEKLGSSLYTGAGK